MYLVLDSSVIIASLVEKEEKHAKCRQLLQRVKDGEFTVLEPYTVLVEVVAAIRRRTGSESLAERIGEDLQRIGNVYFLELLSQRAAKAATVAKSTGLRGMDAILVQIAQEFDAILISLDEEILKKAGRVVKIRHIDGF